MFNIGILGTGNIAECMGNTVCNMENAQIYAVASRSIERAQKFAAKQDERENNTSVNGKTACNCKAYGSYEELVKDDSIDLVYVATPHSEHYDNMMLCIENNKNILCEKAFTANEYQARKVFEAAEEKRVFVCEAMWTRFQPLNEVLSKIASGRMIGKVNMMTGNLHFPMFGKERLWRKSLAGGALLDVGIYPLTIATLIFGFDVDKMTTKVKLSDEGLDERAAAIIEFKNGGIADINWGMTELSDCKVAIYGENGLAIVEGANKMRSIQVFDGSFNLINTYKTPDEEITGYEYEVEACIKAIEEGKLETGQVDWSVTLKMLHLMDEIRKQMGVFYEFEGEETLRK
ncbi:MAG: Gfo/Idh/MocA family oxidoreductase [Lachnospiraceae bacterium]|nr:Gfo/Idh/MocA family oxidoreductase [Lachnospiraceae bacterium]